MEKLKIIAQMIEVAMQTCEPVLIKTVLFAIFVYEALRFFWTVVIN